jgi:hypothetical protein
MNTKDFAEWLTSKKDMDVISLDEGRIFLTVNSEEKLVKLIETTEKSGNIITIHMQENAVVYCLHNQDLDKFVDVWENKSKKNKNPVPDLEWATVKQIADELKSRDSLTFAIVHIEDDRIDNISLEANGDPNYIIGMLTRAVNMLVTYTEKNKKIIENKDDDEQPPESV